jgi:hypothetical protein
MFQEYMIALVLKQAVSVLTAINSLSFSISVIFGPGDF